MSRGGGLRDRVGGGPLVGGWGRGGRLSRLAGGPRALTGLHGAGEAAQALRWR